MTREETAELKEHLKVFIRRVCRRDEMQVCPEEVEILPDIIDRFASLDTAAAGIVEEALHCARKELKVLLRCFALPGGAEYSWKVDTEEAVGKIDQALSALGGRHGQTNSEG